MQLGPDNTHSQWPGCPGMHLTTFLLCASPDAQDAWKAPCFTTLPCLLVNHCLPRLFLCGRWPAVTDLVLNESPCSSRVVQCTHEVMVGPRAGAALALRFASPVDVSCAKLQVRSCVHHCPRDRC